MCLTTTTAPPPMPAMEKPTQRKSAPSVLNPHKRCASDTNLFGLADLDESEVFDDPSYRPGLDFDDSTTSGSDTELDVDGLLVDHIPPTPEARKPKRTVSFGNLEELSFPVVQGDPNFEMAYPMTLAWDHVSESSFSIDEYEEQRGPRARHQNEMRTMTEERRKIIKKSKAMAKELEKNRPRMVRSNSISNGMACGRDKRRNRVQDFLQRMSFGKK